MKIYITPRKFCSLIERFTHFFVFLCFDFAHFLYHLLIIYLVKHLSYTLMISLIHVWFSTVWVKRYLSCISIKKQLQKKKLKYQHCLASDKQMQICFLNTSYHFRFPAQLWRLELQAGLGPLCWHRALLSYSINMKDDMMSCIYPVKVILCPQIWG